MSHPIITRELFGILRTRKALAFVLTMAAAFTLLVLLRWPTDARAILAGTHCWAYLPLSSHS